MIYRVSLSLSILFITFFIAGCSSKQDQEYNKPAIYWYNKMIKQISSYQLDEADDTFVSLESEHKKSPLIPSAMMIIAYAHMQEDEYIMANYYFDEYLTKFSSSKDADYIRYLKIKANFLSFQNQYRDQQLLQETLNEIDTFTKKYKRSQYIYLVETMKARLLMAQALFDKNIASLYRRIDKPKAAKVYDGYAKKSWEDTKSIKDIDVPWYRYIFE